MLQAPPSD